jgi:hypothetical protein
VKRTETRILGKLATGGAGAALTASQRTDLLAKVAKGQKKSRARDIADDVEDEFQQQLAAMTVAEQVIVKRGVADYTQASDAINTSCRNGAPNAAALNLDAMFQIHSNHGFTARQRVVYRLMSYKPPTPCPYGAAAIPQIVAGDLIRDEGFFSSSEHRQFLVNGIKNPPPGTIYVKFVIVGQGGANISGGAYTNAAEQQFLEMNYPKTHVFRTAHAGQAEILFPRRTVLRIATVAAAGRHWHVMATIPVPQPAVAGIKNGFTGT